MHGEELFAGHVPLDHGVPPGLAFLACPRTAVEEHTTLPDTATFQMPWGKHKPIVHAPFVPDKADTTHFACTATSRERVADKLGHVTERCVQRRVARSCSLRRSGPPSRSTACPIDTMVP